MAGAVTYYAGRAPERGLAVYTQKVGMWVFLASEVMFFTSLIGSYIILRFGASETWPLPGEVLNIPITAINTFILICSSVTMVKAFAAAEVGDKRGTRLFTLATALIGSTFLGVQILEYRELLHEGFGPSSGLYGSTFYTMTGFHGFHVFSGVCCLFWASWKAFRGGYDNRAYKGLEVLGLYWHFVDLVWIILFTVVYLI
ncbi:MAG: heme-copper oxidase subunit III [Gemmatimonadetes bacterium]|nr:heme-copper oxidase subunit III [Gemmatimonadota bacterium]